MSALTRRIPRPSAALIVAIVALFMALGGTSYAALKITGKNVANRSLGGNEMKRNTLDGDEIKESTLGPVPKAIDADTVGGRPAMVKMTRGFEAAIPADTGILNNDVVGTLQDLAPGTYVVTAKLTYDNDGAADSQTCTLHVPGGNDSTEFTTDPTDMEVLTLQKLTSSDAVFSPSVTCTSTADNDDIVGDGNIIAVRID